ncbi:MAG TPA: TatD family hydrolase [Bacillota bacterium]|nr:TatD family hydrolase [Bacillota bacterium]
MYCSQMIWFDTHAHIQDEDFREDFPEVLSRAASAGVTRVVMAASNEEDSRAACRLAVHHPMLYAAVGVHPHDAKTWGAGTAARLSDLVQTANRDALHAGRDRCVVACGEIGLDFHYDFSPREAQRDVFRKQLELAHALDLPVIIHMREATELSLSILREAHADGLFAREHPAGVIHCYSGSAETVPALLALGFMIGFDGPITFRKARKPIEALRVVPADRLVLETDAPYLTPHPHRGKRNEPSYIPLIGEKAAEILGESAEIIAARTTANALRLFRIGLSRELQNGNALNESKTV